MKLQTAKNILKLDLIMNSDVNNPAMVVGVKRDFIDNQRALEHNKSNKFMKISLAVLLPLAALLIAPVIFPMSKLVADIMIWATAGVMLTDLVALGVNQGMSDMRLNDYRKLNEKQVQKAREKLIKVYGKDFEQEYSRLEAEVKSMFDSKKSSIQDEINAQEQSRRIVPQTLDENQTYANENENELTK